MSTQLKLLHIFDNLLQNLGPSHWWPASNPFEVCLGAILTQNTNWQNAEKAINNLYKNNLLDPAKLLALPEEQLAAQIKSAGYFRIKARRLKNFLIFLKNEAGLNLKSLNGLGIPELRKKLLQVNGIGPETADSIILYALNRPSFVVDAYTTRIMSRHKLIEKNTDYESLRRFFMDNLPRDTYLYNEFHALLVRVGKNWCKKKQGLCTECPLSDLF